MGRLFVETLEAWIAAEMCSPKTKSEKLFAH
jgi:hypothetical protein